MELAHLGSVFLIQNICGNVETIGRKGYDETSHQQVNAFSFSNVQNVKNLSVLAPVLV